MTKKKEIKTVKQTNSKEEMTFKTKSGGILTNSPNGDDVIRQIYEEKAE